MPKWGGSNLDENAGSELRGNQQKGRAGIITPAGIAFDDTTKAFFAFVTSTNRLHSLIGFENEEFIFPAVHHSFRFSLLLLRAPQSLDTPADLVFFLRRAQQLNDARRHFSLSANEFALLNPNTRTCPVFRSQADSELSKSIYRRVPIFIRESQPEENLWGIRFHSRLFHMAEDSHHFFGMPSDDRVPLYEAKMIHHYDHRWSSYRVPGESVDVTDSEKYDPNFVAKPRYWVMREELESRLSDLGWTRDWMICWRDITSAHVLRTVIAAVVPRVGLGNTLPFLMTNEMPNKVAALLANFSSLVLDFNARQKVGGTHLTYGFLKQLPVLPPDHYTPNDLDFIVPRVLELTYTAHDLAPFAQDLGYDGPPFSWNPERRALLRAELDAYYAKLYGLTRDELRYILDPADIYGDDYPSETFRVLKNSEIRLFGEYRTRRLVLEAWDRLQG